MRLTRPAPHLIAAIGLACALTAMWVLGDRANLARLMLPDTDDLMRLQQVRDWIAGQAFGDLTQYRLADGVAMHWSRIPDLPLAGLILALRPLLGQHAAEVAAVIAWPALKFAALLAIVPAIAARLSEGARWPALILAAVAYPVTGLFAPGRIDHHALQVLLVLVQVWALVRPPSFRVGLVAGLAAATGAAIGLETAPFALVIGVFAVWAGGPLQRGFGIGLAGGLLLSLQTIGGGATCDTVAPLANSVMLGGVAMVATASLGRARWVLLAASAALLVLAFRSDLLACAAGPYGAVDPLLQRLWLSRVQEAQPLLALVPLDILRFAGLLIAGIVAGAWCAWRRRGPWIVLLSFQLASLGVTLIQLRGDYVGAILAVVPIATLLAEARAANHVARTLALWLGGAGLVYPLAASAFASPPVSSTQGCSLGAVTDTLARLPTGRVMAPIDFGAAIVAGTPHTAIAAPYHRSNAANAAMYRFYLGDPAAAQRIATRWRADYVLACPGALSVAPPAGSIGAGARPAWLHPLIRINAVSILAVDRRLLDTAAPR